MGLTERLSECLFPANSPLTAYTKGCRCERCVPAFRAARNASAKRTGINRRVGAVRDRKIAWDDAHDNGKSRRA